MPREITNVTFEATLYSLIKEVTVLFFMYKFKRCRPSTVVPGIPLKVWTPGLGV